MSLISRLSILQKLYLITGLFYVLPIWFLDYFPSLDGVSHIANGIIIKNLLLDENSFYHQFYQFNQYPAPNWLGHALAALFSLFLSPAANEKLIVSICILSFVGAYRYLVISINPKNEYLSYFSLLFALSGPLIYGAHNFCLSISFFMLGFGYWLRNNQHHSFKNFAAYFFIFALTYFSHIFGFGLLCISIFICYFALAIKISKNELLKHFASAAFIPFCAAALFLGLFLYYLSADFNDTNISFPYSMKFREFLFPTSFFMWDIRENIFSAIVFIFVWTLFVRNILHQLSPVSVLVMALVAAFFISPTKFAGGWVIEPRINFVILILASASIGNLGTLAKKWVVRLVILLSLLYTSYNHFMFNEMQPSLRDYYSVESHIEKKSTLMSLDYIDHIIPLENGHIKSSVHYYLVSVPTLIAANQDSLDVFNYEVVEKNTFPLVFRDSTISSQKPPKLLRRWEYWNNKASNPQFIKGFFGVYPKYILIWYRDDLISDQNVKDAKNNFIKTIEKDYKLIFTSKLKLMHLYKRK